MNTITAKQKGFTLIELVIVIVLLGVLSVTIATIFTDTTEAYMQGEARLNASTSARLAVEKIGREIREAMPNSVRVNSSGASNCVEYVPIVAASQYVSLPSTSLGTSITVIEQAADNQISSLNTTNLYVMVIPLNTSEVYNTSRGHFGEVTALTKDAANNQVQVTINPARFNRSSPQERIFFVRQPVSFCVDGNNLNRYTNYGFNPSQPAIGAMGVPVLMLNRIALSNGATTVNAFTYEQASLNRSGLLMMEFFLQGRKETINVKHEVHVRNVP